MKILVTGAAGFIGFHLTRRLLSEGHTVVGLDNICDYYDTNLKFARLAECGIKREDVDWRQPAHSHRHERYTFIQAQLSDAQAIQTLFANERFDTVVNLAGQAGVRYSVENPAAYIESNLVGFFQILENCRQHEVRHLVYASSSSVYGLNGKVPFSESDSIAHPASLYAATKKADELMAHSYSHLYGLPTTGLRFFTVYGPWGRPDMSPFLFADAILHHRPIKVFNNGDMLRDFTYVDDIVESVARIIHIPPTPDSGWDEARPDPHSSSAPYRVYNIGNSHPIRLMDFIAEVEKSLGIEAEKHFLPMQPGDVVRTYADSSRLQNAIGFKPATPLAHGVGETMRWYRSFYGL